MSIDALGGGGTPRQSSIDEAMKLNNKIIGQAGKTANDIVDGKQGKVAQGTVAAATSVAVGASLAALPLGTSLTVGGAVAGADQVTGSGVQKTFAKAVITSSTSSMNNQLAKGKGAEVIAKVVKETVKKVVEKSDFKPEKREVSRPEPKTRVRR